MTTKRFFSFLLFIASMLCMSGCVSGNQPISSPVSTMELARNTLTPPLTNTLSPTISRTKIPTGTPTLTFTLVPTLSADEAYAYMFKFLNNGPDCRLPCWWGITPGQSTVLDVQTQLMAFSGVAEYTHIGKSKGWLVGNLDILYPNNENITVVIDTAYLARSDDNRVSVVSLSTQAYKKTNDSLEMLYGHPLYNTIFEDFSLSAVLYDYGPPNHIFVTADVLYVGLDNNPLPTDTFMIRLLYPDHGIFAQYRMPVERVGDKFRFCPSKAFISLDLLSPNLKHYQDVLLAIGGWEGFFPPSEYNKTPEEALGMTVEEFYRQFRSPTDRCLETPISIWPGR